MIFDQYAMGLYMPGNKETLKILYTHNAEFVMWQRAATEVNSIIKKLLIKLEAFKVKYFEKKVYNKASHVMHNMLSGITRCWHANRRVFES